MAITAGVVTQQLLTASTVKLSATAASGGTGPYTYQWYRDTESGFTPSGSNDIVGATSLALTDTGLVSGITYYYILVATDTGHSNDEVEYAEFVVTPTQGQTGPNQFAQTSVVGMLDLPYNVNTVSCMVDASETATLRAGDPVKVVDSAGGVPKVVAISAESDSIFGFINFDIKSVGFEAGDPCEVSCAGNVMFLPATGAIARMGQVTYDLVQAGRGGVQASAGNTGDTIVGYAYDKASASGDIIRVALKTPSFTVV